MVIVTIVLSIVATVIPMNVQTNLDRRDTFKDRQKALEPRLFSVTNRSLTREKPLGHYSTARLSIKRRNKWAKQ